MCAEDTVVKVTYLGASLVVLLLVGCSGDDDPVLPDGGGISLPEASVCGPSNCSGCCTSGGACIIIQSNENCGSGGKLCQRCTGDKWCYQKVCQTKTGKCSSTTCTGCCDGDSCKAGTTAAACGKGGLPCNSCATGQSCNSKGACACDSTKCQGCCDKNTCKTGTDSNACGKGGGACTGCKTGETCVSGQCKSGVKCDSTTCSGCCLVGQCKAGTDVSACGTGGNTCKTCKTSEKCVSGTCVDTQKCGPSNCSTGCCDGATCKKGTDKTACGTGGGPCQTCKTGENCTSGKCVNPSCGPSSCPSGCCKSGTCEKGNTSTACGSSGKSCAICKSYQTCTSGACAINSTSKWAISVMSASINSSKTWDSWPANPAPDCYVEVTVGSTTGKTTVKSDTHTPYWNDLVVTTTAYDIKNYKLNIKVWDDDFPIDQKVGQCTVSVPDNILAAGSGVSSCGADVTNLRFKFTPN